MDQKGPERTSLGQNGAIWSELALLMLKSKKSLQRHILGQINFGSSHNSLVVHCGRQEIALGKLTLVCNGWGRPLRTKTPW